MKATGCIQKGGFLHKFNQGFMCYQYIDYIQLITGWRLVRLYARKGNSTDWALDLTVVSARVNNNINNNNHLHTIHYTDTNINPTGTNVHACPFINWIAVFTKYYDLAPNSLAGEGGAKRELSSAL